MKNLMTPVEVADLLQVAVRTLADWRYRKVGPRYIKVGQVIRYKREDINAYMRQRAVKPKE